MSSGQLLPEPPPSASPIWGQLCSPVFCGRERLDRVVPAIWGGEVILIRLHPPPMFSFAQNTVQDCPTLLLPQRPAPLQLFSFVLTRPGIGAEEGRCQSCRWRPGAHGGLRTFLDPMVVGSSSHRPEEQYSG